MPVARFLRLFDLKRAVENIRREIADTRIIQDVLLSAYILRDLMFHLIWMPRIHAVVCQEFRIIMDMSSCKEPWSIGLKTPQNAEESAE